MPVPLGPELIPEGPFHIRWEDRRLRFFAGNDYHRLSHHPEVMRSAAGALREFGLSAAGSRMTTANHPLYSGLEAAVAAFLGVEAAAVLSAGYMANAALVQAVAPESARLFLEATAHPSLVDAARGTGLPVIRFADRDPDDLRRRLAAEQRASERALVLTDGVTPGTGVLAPLAAYAEAAVEYGATVLVDDAHGAGVLGERGRGSWEEAGLVPGATLQAGTLSKAFGAFGGFVAGSAALIRQVHARSQAFVGSTPLPLPLAAAGIAAVRVLAREPDRIARLQSRARVAKAALANAGYRLPDGAAPILSLAFAEPERSRALQAHLLERGIYPPLIRYPGAPAGGHFRFTLSSAHPDADVDRLLTALLDFSA